MIEIDGSKGEGGGQMLRTSLSLGSVLQESVHIENIRASRPKPGLAPQHLSGVELLKDLTNAKVEGASLGSTDVKFTPSKPHGDYFYLDIGTAGSIPLLFQTALYPAVFSDYKTELELRGGTDVKWSPPADYIKEVFLPASGLVEFIQMDIRRRGYYPKGGGDVLFRVSPGKPGPLILLPGGRLKGIHARIHLYGLSDDIAKRMAEGVKKVLGKDVYFEDVQTGQSRSPGCGVTLWAETDTGGMFGAAGLGERSIRAETVGENAAKALKEEIDSGASVDVHLADQLLIPLALFGGEFTCRELSGHAKTNIEVIKLFLGDVIQVEKAGENCRVYSDGMK